MIECERAPPGRQHSFLHFRFCKTCGIRTSGPGGDEAQSNGFCSVSVAALDDVDPEQLAAAPIRYVDGRNDRYDQSPRDTGLM